MLKKNTLFTSFLTMLCYILLTSFAFAIAFIVTNNESISYLLCYIFMISFLLKRHYKDLKEQLFSFKECLKGNTKNIIIICSLFTILLYTSNYTLYHIFHIIAKNEELARASFFQNPFLMGINIALLAPIVEELTYRYPYQTLKKHRFFIYLFYSFLFALTHMASIATLGDCLFFIPYLFLSLTFGYGVYKTDNIFMSIILHIFNNSLNIMLLLII